MKRWGVILAAGLSLAACRRKSDEANRGPGSAAKGNSPKEMEEMEAPPAAAADPSVGFGGGAPKTAQNRGAMGRKDAPAKPAHHGGLDLNVDTKSSLSGEDGKKKGKHEEADKDGQDDSAGKETATTRSWFPETFLFEPLIVTDDHGSASVKVLVPDRLTTWHVLALAHARNGAQAGATASFLGTLPAYVDPVVPPFLLAGDEVRLPVQIVNTTDKPVSGNFHMNAENATLTAKGGALSIPAQGSLTEYATLRTGAPGTATVTAGLGATDAVKKTVEVLPAGRPVTTAKAGTLAAPRAFDIAAPADADPVSARVRLQVFPGALALLRSELAVAVGRGGVAEDAYALLLAGRAPELLQMLGEKADPEAVRTLALLIGQRVIRHGRSPDVATATLLAEAALAHPDRPVLARLGERMVQTLAGLQRPDGSFGGATGWTLQRLLVTTADAVRAVSASNATPAAKQRAHNVRVRAMGMVERNFARIDDPYTAAALLAAGLVDGPLADKLRDLVMKAIQPRDDGSKWLLLSPGVMRADGVEPSLMEATALAVLALDGVGGSSGSAGRGGEPP